MWLARHGQYIRRLGGLAQALVASGERGARVGIVLAAADALAEMVGPDAYAVVSRWPRIHEMSTLDCVLRHVLGPPPTNSGAENGQIVTIAGIHCVRTQHDFYVDGDPEAVRTALRCRLWEALGPNLEVVTSTDPGGDAAPAQCADLQPADAVERSTHQGAALIARLRPFVERAGGTSVMLIGEPGCGKTTAAAEAVAALGASRAMRVSVSQLERVGESALRTLVRFIQPQVLVIDDVDRHEDPSELLTLFDEAGRHARLRIATCNFPRKLGSALLRPGRFDLHVRSEDPEVAVARRTDAAEVLANAPSCLPSEVLDEVVGWPIAFAADLAKRLQVVGSWEREVAELRRRLEEQRAMDGDEDGPVSRPATPLNVPARK